jgi:predicted nuclease of predicted toxin-antitoxin system
LVIRFHLDEHISLGVAAGLRRRGIDVTCAADVNMAAATDEQQLAFATAEGRVLVTHDADFLRLHRAGAAHAGIAYARQGSLTIGETIRRLVLIHDLLKPEEMRERVEFV